MLKTLSFIGENLKNRNITWAVGGSLLLSFYNIIDKPNDIDILVDETDAIKMNEIMSSIGKTEEACSAYPFRTMHFSKYKINGVGIDVMGGFAIQHEEGIYKIPMRPESIVAHQKIDGEDIPLSSLEDWYILYWLIPNKKGKALLIEDFWRNYGIRNPQILREALKQSLPLEVKHRVEQLVK